MFNPCIASQQSTVVTPVLGAPVPPALVDLSQRTRVTRRAGSLLLALAVGLTGLLSAWPIQPAAAAPFPVTLRLTIERVTALHPAEFGDCNGPGADFYPVVHMNGGPELTQPAVPNHDDITPTNWQFETSIPPSATNPPIPITVEIRDDDNDFWACGASAPDDIADITPISNSYVLELTVNLAQIPCLVAGGLTGRCGQSITVQGNGGKDGGADSDARITYRVEAFVNLPDSDGDGIPDDWEQNGITLNGQFINLPAMGADKNKADIFVHLDWLEGEDSQGAYHDERLTKDVIQEVVDAFANAPFQNPTGVQGITLHVDHADNSVNMGPVTPQARHWPWMPLLIPRNSPTTSDWSAFDQVKNRPGGFVSLGRSPIFHYGIAAPDGGVQNASGIARGVLSSDFVVAQGQWALSRLKAKTLMHELGHNLGLDHGGDEDVNYKPNYISIMNYLFTAGVDTAGRLDYSRAVLPLLNETSLNENLGLGPDAAHLLSHRMCSLASAATPNVQLIPTNAIEAGPIDWNCDGPIQSQPVAFDINGDRACVTPGMNGLASVPAEDDDYDDSGTIIVDGPDRICDTYAAPGDVQEAEVGTRHPSELHGFDDWGAIQLRVGAVGALDTGAMPLVTPSEPALPAPHGADLELAHTDFYFTYTAHNSTTRDITLVPTTTGVFPFNTADRPFRLPCDVQNFGGQLQAHLVSAASPVYWKVTIRFLQADGTVIVSHGFSGVHSFAYGAAPVTPPVSPGMSADAGYTPLSTINIFRDWMYQPADLGQNTPVRMEVRVDPYADAQHIQLLEDSNPSNNVVNVWVMRACGS